MKTTSTRLVLPFLYALVVGECSSNDHNRSQDYPDSDLPSDEKGPKVPKNSIQHQKK